MVTSTGSAKVWWFGVTTSAPRAGMCSVPRRSRPKYRRDAPRTSGRSASSTGVRTALAYRIMGSTERGECPGKSRGAPVPTACLRQKNGAGIAPGPVMQSREGCLFVVGAGLDLDGLELELAATPLQAVLATHAGLNFR